MSALKVFLGVLLLSFVAVNALVATLERPVLETLRYDLDDAVGQLSVLDPGRPVDVVFLGSSRVMFGLDPQTLTQEAERLGTAGVTAVNVGVPGARLDVAALILKNRLLGSQKPKLIVYGASEFELLGAPDVERFEGLSNVRHLPVLMRPDDVATYGGSTLLERMQFIGDTAVPLLRYRTAIRDALNLRFNAEHQYHTYLTEGPRHRTPRSDGLWTFPPDWPQPTAA